MHGKRGGCKQTNEAGDFPGDRRFLGRQIRRPRKDCLAFVKENWDAELLGKGSLFGDVTAFIEYRQAAWACQGERA